MRSVLAIFAICLFCAAAFGPVAPVVQEAAVAETVTPVESVAYVPVCDPTTGVCSNDCSNDGCRGCSNMACEGYSNTSNSSNGSFRNRGRWYPGKFASKFLRR